MLETLGLDFDVVAPDVDESRLQGEAAVEYVDRIARLKARAVGGIGQLVLAADTTVVHGGRVMGKPGHPEEARAMLRLLQGDTHQVMTGVAVVADGNDDDVISLVEATDVVMLPMTEDEISAYVATGEPMDKAGAYALQGLGSLHVGSVKGSPSNVIGLPVHLLPRLFGHVGFSVDDFRVDGAHVGNQAQIGLV